MESFMILLSWILVSSHIHNLKYNFPHFIPFIFIRFEKRWLFVLWIFHKIPKRLHASPKRGYCLTVGCAMNEEVTKAFSVQMWAVTYDVWGQSSVLIELLLGWFHTGDWLLHHQLGVVLRWIAWSAFQPVLARDTAPYTLGEGNTGINHKRE